MTMVSTYKQVSKALGKDFIEYLKENGIGYKEQAIGFDLTPANELTSKIMENRFDYTFHIDGLRLYVMVDNYISMYGDDFSKECINDFIDAEPKELHHIGPELFRALGR